MAPACRRWRRVLNEWAEIAAAIGWRAVGILPTRAVDQACAEGDRPTKARSTTTAAQCDGNARRQLDRGPDSTPIDTSKTVGLPVASADTITLTRAALLATKAVYRQGYRYKKAGITLLELSTSEKVQGDLWTTPDTPRSKSLMAAIDAINGRHGRETIKLAGSGIERGWKLRSEQRSAHFTTDWKELLQVF